MLIPTYAAGWSFDAAALTSSGISDRHGGHADHHTFTTTTWPRRSERDSCRPSRVVPVSSIGSPRSAALTCVIWPSPEMYCCPPVPERPSQPVAAPVIRRASSRTRGRRARMSGTVLLGSPAGREGGAPVADRDQVAGGLGVGDTREGVVGEVQAGQRAERA